MWFSPHGLFPWTAVALGRVDPAASSAEALRGTTMVARLVMQVISSDISLATEVIPLATEVIPLASGCKRFVFFLQITHTQLWHL